MTDPEHVTEMSADERLREAASILAAGVVRLHRRCALRRDDGSKTVLNCVPAGLEVPGETRLTVRVG